MARSPLPSILSASSCPTVPPAGTPLPPSCTWPLLPGLLLLQLSGCGRDTPGSVQPQGLCTGSAPARNPILRCQPLLLFKSRLHHQLRRKTLWDPQLGRLPVTPGTEPTQSLAAFFPTLFNGSLMNHFCVVIDHEASGVQSQGPRYVCSTWPNALHPVCCWRDRRGGRLTIRCPQAEDAALEGGGPGLGDLQLRAVRLDVSRGSAAQPPPGTRASPAAPPAAHPGRPDRPPGPV